MIILDTNVLSELIRPRPALEVMRWLDAQDPLLIFTTSITVQELAFGVELLGDTQRGRELGAACDRLFSEHLHGRKLPYTEISARYAAGTMAYRRRIGRPIAMADAQIAGITLAHGATLATRNIRDFAGMRLAVVNPWLR